MSTEGLQEIKTLLIGLDQKVNGFSTKLDQVECKFSQMLAEVKNEVDGMKTELTGCKAVIKSIRHDHNELEKGVAEIELQLTALEVEKLENTKKTLQAEIDKLRDKQILLEKHERKYNVLVYGVPENRGENIMDTVQNFFINDLGISEAKADEIPIANAHRVPSRSNNPQSKTKTPDAIIIRFIHYADKQFVMSNAFKLFGKKLRILDDLPVVMKQERGRLARIAYKIRNDEKLQTRIRDVETKMVLETRLGPGDKWQFRC